MSKLSLKQKRLLSLLLIGVSSFLILFVANIIMVQANDPFTVVLGNNGLLLMLLIALIGYNYSYHQSIFKEKNKLILYVSLCTIVILPSLILTRTIYYWLMPILIATMIISIMLNETLGILTNIFMALVLAIIGKLGFEFLFFYITSGTIASILIKLTRERQKIFYVSIYMMAIHSLMIFLFSLVRSAHSLHIPMNNMIFAILNAIFSVIITVGSLPLFETIFDILTPHKLLELVNSDQKLLQRLMLEAPGTYHHSQMVANLAETATADIGGNALLARTGALYHDVGKLKQPEYFTENQNGTNPHDDLAPDASATIIISHVDFGVKMAKEYKLPKSVIDIIRQHQGDALVKYFYHKAKDHSDGFEIDDDAFRYDGPKPQTNEAAIVMLADCVEAYIRGLDEVEREMSVIDESIKKVIHNKFQEGQLNESDLKVKDLHIIANAFKKVYTGMYHERIKYPKEEEVKN